MFTKCMGFLDSIKGLLGSEERTFTYVCEKCETEFESSEPKMVDVGCPECRSTQIRSPM